MRSCFKHCICTLNIASVFLTIATQRSVAVELKFAGRNWKVKESNEPVGPGPNRYSANPKDVWVDDQGLHLTIHKRGEYWVSTEVILDASLGYGTYLFRTTSRQDLLNDYAVFGAFTWDESSDDKRIPDYPNREIDFEDSRWGDPAAANSQIVVQPGKIPGNHFRFELPDLSRESTLTRYFKWGPGSVDFASIHGKYDPNNSPTSAVFHQHHYVENEAMKNIVPRPGRENFRFNLWLYKPKPKQSKPIEVSISDFVFTPLVVSIAR